MNDSSPVKIAQPEIIYRERNAVVEVKNMLTQSECDALIATGLDTNEMKEGGLYNHQGDDTQYTDARRSKIAWLRLPDDPSVRRIFETIVEVNSQMFDFKIKFRADIGLQFTVYEPGGHYTWHRDWNVTKLANRKLSIVLQLTDPAHYGGGGLEIYTGHEDRAYSAPREQGSMLVFPSFMMHRVVPVEWGVRYSLVLWATGPNLS